MTGDPLLPAGGPADLIGAPGRVRLNRFLAQAGIASRRAADRLIAAGRVRVNGAPVEVLGLLVLPGRDAVEVDGVAVGGIEVPRYVIMNKPRGILTTASDPQGRPTVLDLLGGGVPPARLFPVGRLDRDSEGLLLLTNDGTLAHRLLHPRYHVAKRYRVWTEPAARPADLEQLAAGVEIEAGLVSRPALVEAAAGAGGAAGIGGAVGTAAPGGEFEIEVREGKKRQIRRMCEAVGLRVTRLVRIRLGPIELGGLEPGAIRPLAPAEVEELERAAGLTQRRGRSS